MIVTPEDQANLDKCWEYLVAGNDAVRVAMRRDATKSLVADRELHMHVEALLGEKKCRYYFPGAYL